MKNSKQIILTILISVIFVSKAAAEYQKPESKEEEKFIFATRKYAQRSHWYWGLGAVVSDVPVMQSRFKIPFSQVLYEYNFGDLNSNVRFSMGGGFYGLMAILPVPAIQPSLYIGSENNDVMGRFSLGGFSDFVVGGHSGVLLSAGVVIKNRIDVSIVGVPYGTQPVRPYPELLGSREEEYIPVSDVRYARDPFGNQLKRYDSNHYHQDDDKRYDGTSQQYYSSYDMDYGNASFSGDTKTNPGDFDYVTRRDYIKYPYFGLMVTFRH